MNGLLRQIESLASLAVASSALASSACRLDRSAGWCVWLIGHLRVAALHERLEVALQVRARDQDATLTDDAAQSDVRPQSDHRPVRRAARVLLPQSHHVAHEQLERPLHRCPTL